MSSGVIRNVVYRGSSGTINFTNLHSSFAVSPWFQSQELSEAAPRTRSRIIEIMFILALVFAYGDAKKCFTIFVQLALDGQMPTVKCGTFDLLLIFYFVAGEKIFKQM